MPPSELHFDPSLVLWAMLVKGVAAQPSAGKQPRRNLQPIERVDQPGAYSGLGGRS